jgi:hypothetical protein
MTPDQLTEHAEMTGWDNLDLVLEAIGINLDDYECRPDQIRGCCPIHGGDNPTAFAINTKAQLWACYTNLCHKQYGPRLVNLVAHIKEMRVEDAARFILVTCGIVDDAKMQQDMPNVSAIMQAKREVGVRDHIHSEEYLGLNIPVEKFLAVREPCFRYKNQGLTEETIEKFMISICVDPRKRMYNRTFAPVLSSDGSIVVGFQGRTLYDQCKICGMYHSGADLCPSDGGPRSVAKWLTFGIQEKGRVLYNLHNFDESLGYVILVEGPKDVWFADQFGIQNVVACLGCTLSFGQIQLLLQKNVEKVLFAFNNDDPGSKGIEIGIKDARKYLWCKDIRNFGNAKDIGEMIPSEVAEFKKGLSQIVEIAK